MAKKKKEAEGGGGAPEWMTTYGDLVTLLMCFFVLLFAFSTIDKQKFVAVMQSFQGSAGVLQSGQSLVPADMVFDGMPENKETKDETSIDLRKELEVIEDAVEEFKARNQVDLDIEVSADVRGVMITLPDSALFDPAKANIKEDALIILSFMYELLMQEAFVEREIQIEGHTDNVPINTPQFPSNWVLSAIRANNVLNYFIDDKKMSPDRFSIAGYGEYRPVDSNETPEGRAKNRRVDIVVLYSRKQLEEQTE